MTTLRKLVYLRVKIMKLLYIPSTVRFVVTLYSLIGHLRYMFFIIIPLCRKAGAIIKILTLKEIFVSRILNDFQTCHCGVLFTKTLRTDI